ncbi:MAG: SMC-Scp complex subunit ScpB [Candidatus Omnitrophica bacterium]|nr:SMC-Scp complex subunit ScpB [Candidatus Omnitrophota bacterium]
MVQDNRKSVIEALLLASEKPLPIELIRNALDNLDLALTRSLIEELKLEYEETNRGMRIVEIAGGFQMITAPGFAPFLKKLFKSRNAERLSKPALETLAIIAYKQPLTRGEIELLRNVNVDGVMKNLLDKNLIRICGRKKAAGRPYVYGTTRIFLEHFGLKSLEDLPKIEDFSKLAEEKEVQREQTTVVQITEGLNETEKTAQ